MATGRPGMTIIMATCGMMLTASGYWLVAAYLDKESSKAEQILPLISSSGDAPRPGSKDCPLEVVESGDGHRVVRHVLGTSLVPCKPKRVCALGYVDELLAIGVKPFAASCSHGHFPDYLEDRLDGVIGIAQMMSVGQPDFETLVTVQPDLIITSNPDPQMYRQLSKIAPVVVLTDNGNDNGQRLLDLGELVARRAEAEARLAWYRAKVQTASNVLHEKIGDRCVAFFRVFGKQYYIHGHTRGGSVLYDELGLTPPSLIDSHERGCMLSPEVLLDLNAEYVFVAAEKTKGTFRTWQELLDHPAWQRVPAVRDEQVFWLDSFHQWLVPGLLAKSQMIDEILRSIAPESIEVVNSQADLAMWAKGS